MSATARRSSPQDWQEAEELSKSSSSKSEVFSAPPAVSLPALPTLSSASLPLLDWTGLPPNTELLSLPCWPLRSSWSWVRAAASWDWRPSSSACWCSTRSWTASSSPSNLVQSPYCGFRRYVCTISCRDLISFCPRAISACCAACLLSSSRAPRPASALQILELEVRRRQVASLQSVDDCRGVLLWADPAHHGLHLLPAAGDDGGEGGLPGRGGRHQSYPVPGVVLCHTLQSVEQAR